MRLSIKLIFLLVTLFACLELSNAAPKSRGKGGKLKSPTNSLYINSAERHFYETKFEIGAEIYIQSAPNNSNETYSFMIGPFWTVLKLLENSNMKFEQGNTYTIMYRH